MRYLSLVLVAAGLLLQVSGAHAISFAPDRTVAVGPVGGVGTGGAKPLGLSVGVAASSWGLPNVATAIGTLEFDSKVRPLLTAEYQLDNKWSVGGWYNFISWGAKLNPAPGALPAGAAIDAKVDGGMFEVHGTRAFPLSDKLVASAQLGYLHQSLDINVTARQSGAVVASDKSTANSDFATLWGLASYKLSSNENAGTGLIGMGGLGLFQGLNSGNTLNGHLLVGASYSFSPKISADVSYWLTDVTRRDPTSRFTMGVTGRF